MKGLLLIVGGCLRCHGTAFNDDPDRDDEWRCLQCARRVPKSVVFEARENSRKLQQAHLAVA